jgi:integrase/recombinase XerD
LFLSSCHSWRHSTSVRPHDAATMFTRKYGAQAQVKQPGVTAKRVNPHTIRHTSAMHLLRAGNDINMVSYRLGHADINTTHIYVEIDMEMKQKMIARAGAPDVGHKTPWQQPHVLHWLKQLNKEPQLCGLNY